MVQYFHTILNTFLEQGDNFHPGRYGLRNDLWFCGGKLLLIIYSMDCICISRYKSIRAINFICHHNFSLCCGLLFGRALLGKKRHQARVCCRDIRWLIRSSGLERKEYRNEPTLFLQWQKSLRNDWCGGPSCVIQPPSPTRQNSSLTLKSYKTKVIQSVILNAQPHLSKPQRFEEHEAGVF